MLQTFDERNRDILININGDLVPREPKDDGPFSALVFKIMTDPFVGQLAFFRSYSGTMKTGDTLLNATTGRKERIGRLLKMHANKREELDEMVATVFDVLFASSTRNDEPDQTPRPFDAARDGLVTGEGAGTLILEELERARERGATIHAEVLGFGTTCDGMHLTTPDPGGMERAMRAALDPDELVDGSRLGAGIP